MTGLRAASGAFLAVATLLAGALDRPARGQAAGAAEPAEHYSITGWTTADGLPSNVARDIVQTPDGFLWLASFEGLVRFDGLGFRAFTEAQIPGLSRASFRRVAVDPEGALWAASETGGVVRLARGRWSVFTTAHGLRSDRVTALITDAGGTVWVGTRGGINRIQSGRVAALTAPRGIPEPAVSALARDREGSLWIGTVADGLLRYRDGAFTRWKGAEGLPDERVTALGVDRGGTLWVGTFGGLARLEGDRLLPVPSLGAEPGPINDMAQDREGTWWVAADNGLFRVWNRRLVGVPQPDGRPFNQAEGLHADREGNLWVGSRHGGLFRVRRSSVRMVSRADGLPHDFVAVVAGDTGGTYWVGTRAGLVHRGKRGITTYSQEGGVLRDNVVRDVLRDRQGDVWVATNSGLTRLRRGRASTLTPRDGLPDERVRVLLEDRSGALWIGTYNGLARLANGRLQRYDESSGLADPYVLSLFEDREGTLWVGTQSAGLFRRDGERFVPGPAELTRQPIFRLSQDRDGTLWVGTTRGLARLRGRQLTTFTTREGLPGNTVFQALDDGDGALWLTGPWGIARVRREHLDAVASGGTRVVHAKEFGTSDGLAAREVSSIGRAWASPDGILYFPTPAGLALIDPRRVPLNQVAPITHLERTVADDLSFEGGVPVELPPGRNRLELHFTSPSFVAPGQVRFRYRLDGFDPAWVEGGARRTAYYTNLPPGRYTFRVQARNEDGVWSQQAAMVPVRLRPHFWQTWWFTAAAALALLALAVVIHRFLVQAAEMSTREEVLRAMSLRDELTGLYNRRGLVALGEQQIEASRRTGTALDVLFIDMDRMKEINDSYGHAEGDRALTDAAALLRTTFRRSDVVARLGGDEFAVLVIGRTPGQPAEEQAAAAIARLSRALERYNASSRRPYPLSLSVGSSRFDPGAPTTLDELLEAADRAMYAQKRLKAAVQA